MTLRRKRESARRKRGARSYEKLAFLSLNETGMKSSLSFVALILREDAPVKNTISLTAMAILMLSVTVFAQQPSASEQQTHPPAQAPAPATVKPCVIVQHEGGHTLRNVMLLGVVGAVISKERYKVVESNVAGLNPGEKMHGDELQARTQGTKVVVMGKKEALAEARNACNATPVTPAASAAPAASAVQAK